MKVFAKFDEIPSMILEVIKETKRYGHTFRITKGNIKETKRYGHTFGITKGNNSRSIGP